SKISRRTVYSICLGDPSHVYNPEHLAMLPSLPVLNTQSRDMLYMNPQSIVISVRLCACQSSNPQLVCPRVMVKRSGESRLWLYNSARSLKDVDPAQLSSDS